MNPVLARELKERARTWRGAVVLTLYLATMSFAVYLTYESKKNSTGAGFSAVDATSIGRSIFEWIIILMLLLVLFLVPGLTAGAICGERERQTLVPLQVTMLRPRSILLGKVFSAQAYVLLLIFATMPMLGLTYLLGGVTLTDIAAGIAAVFVVAIIVGLFCIGISSFFRRVQTATVVSYGMVLFLLLGTGVTYRLIQDVWSDDGNAPEEILYLNPAYAVADATRPDNSAQVDTPLSDFRDDVSSRSSGFGNRLRPRSETRPFWMRSLVVSASLALLITVLSTRRVRAPAKTER